MVTETVEDREATANDDNEDVWNNILTQGMQKKIDDSKKTIVFVGDGQSGKTSLISRMVDGSRSTNMDEDLSHGLLEYSL